MKEIIIEKIKAVETANNVSILLACESGSRAWGFPSPDSDYDVRFIYVHPKEWYLSISEGPDFIDLTVNEVLDINGWDLRKALRLLVKSNAVLYEWMQSPIVYKADAAFHAGFRELARDCFSPIAVMHHYLSMAKNKYKECLSEEDVKLKRYMYCLRATLSARWIANYQLIPPMELTPLLNDIDDTWFKEKVKELVALKAGQAESYRHPHERLLEEKLFALLEEAEQVAPDLSAAKFDRERPDLFFRKMVADR